MVGVASCLPPEAWWYCMGWKWPVGWGWVICGGWYCPGCVCGVACRGGPIGNWKTGRGCLYSDNLVDNWKFIHRRVGLKWKKQVKIEPVHLHTMIFFLNTTCYFIKVTNTKTTSKNFKSLSIYNRSITLYCISKQNIHRWSGHLANMQAWMSSTGNSPPATPAYYPIQKLLPLLPLYQNSLGLTIQVNTHNNTYSPLLTIPLKYN